MILLIRRKRLSEYDTRLQDTRYNTRRLDDEDITTNEVCNIHLSFLGMY